MALPNKCSRADRARLVPGQEHDSLTIGSFIHSFASRTHQMLDVKIGKREFPYTMSY